MIKASVFLGDLSDFIEPSQACINPLFADVEKAATAPATAVAPADAAQPQQLGGAKLVLDYADDGISAIGGDSVRPNLIRAEVSSTSGTGSTKKATVSLCRRQLVNNCVFLFR